MLLEEVVPGKFPDELWDVVDMCASVWSGADWEKGRRQWLLLRGVVGDGGLRIEDGVQSKGDVFLSGHVAGFSF